MAERSVFPLNEGWVFKQADDEKAEFLSVSQFPTNVHLDLMHHGLIPDPFTGKNELDVQWVGEKPWVYKTSFDAPALKDGDKAVLAFDGLDTHAAVLLNGTKILETENMFIPERVDVTELLRESKRSNVLNITFESTYLIGKKIKEQYPNHRWGCWNGDCSRLAVRKAQYHYGWDWGPTLMTCGPWRPVNLEIYNARISDLHFRQNVDKSLKQAELVVTAEVEGNAGNVTFHISLSGEEKGSETVDIKDGIATVTFHVQDPQLWYPSTYGKQPLYTLSATLSSNGVKLDSSSKRVGLRRAELIQREMNDAEGTSFFFEINNIPVFCGGSDWIPADNFIPRISPQRYHDWVKLMVDGNQVMVRVWGGGIFEEQPFYDACDELGLLVWQDFLFGCGNYPVFPSFLKTVKREAIANVKILRHHPSIVIWAGNNEDYQYAESEKLIWDPSDNDPNSWLKSEFPARYIYEKILVDVTKDLIPDTYYHFGSPWGGKNTADPTIGDIHQWNVWHGTQEKYQNFDKLGGRFVSEFGLQGFPDMRTIDGYLPGGKADPDRYPQSSTVDFHNKAAGHERRIALYLAENIQYNLEPFEQYVYGTQLIQAECLASAYRLWKRQWKGPGREYCAGILVWQMNDCWPVTSWAIVDYHLRPKHAFYAVKRELAPITIGLKRTSHTEYADKYTNAFYKTTHKIEMWASNLTVEARRVCVMFKAWDVVTGRETYSKKLHDRFVLEENRSVEITEFEVPVEGKEGESKDGEEANRTVVAAYLIENGKQVARYVNWPEPLRYTHLQAPKKLQVTLSEDGKQVGLSAEVPVKGVAIYADEDEVVFEDNCLDLVPGETVYIGVKGLEKGQGDRISVRYLGSS
ncbi:beta-mannosidase [[Emmonsia] crescens]|uniref:Beta-mannosidase B n=1 Tax=[Emmonsia] crescens TaxID=73230 RepID=A0A0G2I5H2_9EURO|nr:beta-mannosidase [Emmonsia crescens UAMH 3008]